jgi:hypothetical protein
MKRLLIFLLCIPSLIFGQTVVIDSYTGGSSSMKIYTSLYVSRGQSFSCSGAYILDSCRFQISRYGSPTGNVYANIYAHSGTFGSSSVPSGTALATSSTLNIASLTTSATWKTFSFTGANAITLSPSTYYVISLFSNNGDASNYLYIKCTSTATNHSGNGCTTADGSSWASSTYDNNFIVYGHSASSVKKLGSVAQSAIKKAGGEPAADTKKIGGVPD